MGTTLLASGLTTVVLAATLAVSYGGPAATVEPVGHLILQIEGDATGLEIVRITAKPDPCGPLRDSSAVSILVLGQAGTELGRYPLDLSRFDLRPTRVGGAIQVEGCVIHDPRVATLASIPHHPNAERIKLMRGNTTLGSLNATAYRQKLSAGQHR